MACVPWAGYKHRRAKGLHLDLLLTTVLRVGRCESFRSKLNGGQGEDPGQVPPVNGLQNPAHRELPGTNHNTARARLREKLPMLGAGVPLPPREEAASTTSDPSPSAPAREPGEVFSPQMLPNGDKAH